MDTATLRKVMLGFSECVSPNCIGGYEASVLGLGVPFPLDPAARKSAFTEIRIYFILGSLEKCDDPPAGYFGDVGKHCAGRRWQGKS